MKQGCKIVVEDGQLVEGKRALGRLVKSQDGVFMIEKSPYKKDRTLRQNNWYWKVLTFIGEELGYHPKELHEVFLDEFAPIWTTRNLKGKPVQKPVRSSAMDVEQFGQYLDSIIQFAAEHSIIIPDPEDYR